MDLAAKQQASGEFDPVRAELAPDVIEVGADGIASLRVGSSADPNVLEAANSCPMGAITVHLQEAA